MSDVARAGYFDNRKSRAISETIKKEERIREQWLMQQDSQGVPSAVSELPAIEPEEQPHRLSSIRSITGPVESARPQLPPDQAALASISQKLWSNLGYCAPAARFGPSLMSTTAADFTYDTEEGMGFDNTKTHFRKRDKITAYVEAAARLKAAGFKQ